MEQFLKRISFFLIYLPALVYACQFAYYAGLGEPLNIHVTSLGLNYPEVVLMGYLYISLPVLQFILWSAISITLILCIVFVTFSIRWLQKHKGTKIEYREYIQKSFKRVKIGLDKQKKDLIKAINSLVGILGLYFVIFIFTFLLILFYYKLGIKEIEDKVQEIFNSQACDTSDGYITSNNTKVRVKTILCGYNKCYGISLDNKEAIIYPPEQSAQPISRIKKLKEAP
ncbi:hypothetical protein ACTJJH_15755 [Acinetobacter sp. 22301]|uniref:hypothetical protein n=1 Tax=Acinetobacter sp. 22301 TaxID=3453904 RepID=UPI003F83D9DF